MFNSTFSRRKFLKTAAIASTLTSLSALNSVSFASNGSTHHTVINLFLPGGMDSLSAIIPYTEQAYFDSRPTTHIPEEGRIALNGQFGLHMSLEPLLPFYDNGDLALVVASGIKSGVRLNSHFDAMKRIDSGVDDGGQDDGWLGRYLRKTSDPSVRDDIFRGMDMGGSLRRSIWGYEDALGVSKLSSLKLSIPNKYRADRIPLTLQTLYQATDHSLLENQAMLTLDTLSELEGSNLVSTVVPEEYGNGNSAVGNSLHQVAKLIKAEVGLEAANVSMGGWDLHSNMGDWKTGRLSKQFSELSESLSAFYNEIAVHRQKVTTVVMSEFGRPLKENSSGGTDHGRGGAMMVLGGGINGGQIYGSWPGLGPNDLVGGDLKVTTDYRKVLAELIDRRLGHPELLGKTFPDYSPDGYLDIFN